jgi:hypothetical protein
MVKSLRDQDQWMVKSLRDQASASLNKSIDTTQTHTIAGELRYVGKETDRKWERAT